MKPREAIAWRRRGGGPRLTIVNRTSAPIAQVREQRLSASERALILEEARHQAAAVDRTEVWTNVLGGVGMYKDDGAKPVLAAVRPAVAVRVAWWRRMLRAAKSLVSSVAEAGRSPDSTGYPGLICRAGEFLYRRGGALVLNVESDSPLSDERLAGIRRRFGESMRVVIVPPSAKAPVAFVLSRLRKPSATNRGPQT